MQSTRDPQLSLWWELSSSYRLNSPWFTFLHPLFSCVTYFLNTKSWPFPMLLCWLTCNYRASSLPKHAIDFYVYSNDNFQRRKVQKHFFPSSNILDFFFFWAVASIHSFRLSIEFGDCKHSTVEGTDIAFWGGAAWVAYRNFAAFSSQSD